MTARSDLDFASHGKVTYTLEIRQSVWKSLCRSTIALLLGFAAQIAYGTSFREHLEHIARAFVLSPFPRSNIQVGYSKTSGCLVYIRLQLSGIANWQQSLSTQETNPSFKFAGSTISLCPVHSIRLTISPTNVGLRP